jgi:GNAT superfamily N-acetyltransferase
MSDAPLIGSRNMSPGDRPFVASSWFESYWKATASQEMDFPVYRAAYPQRIDRALDIAQTLVVHSAEFPDEILGYAVFTPNPETSARDVLQYVYVKSVYRRQGIATGLIRRATKYTHKTRLGEKLLEKHDVTFNPFLIP